METISALFLTDNKKQIRIYTVDGLALSITAATAKAGALAVGGDISEQTKRRLLDMEYNAAYEKAVKLLASRAHSAKEIREKLYNRGYTKDIVAKVVERLLELCYLNDKDFAALTIESFKSYSKIALKFKLREAGVDSEIIDEMLGEYDEYPAAEVSAKKYLRSHKFDRKKFYAHLKNKGFSEGAVRYALSKQEEGEN